MSYAFNSTTISENNKEATLKCRLKGFKPSDGHSATASVSNNVLVVTANIGSKSHQYTINGIDVGSDAISVKPKNDEVNVVIRKPNGEYTLSSRMQR